MRILHSHDPSSGDDRALTLDEIKASVARAHHSM